MPRLHRLRLVPLAALLGSCGGGDLSLPDEGTPAEIQVIRGDRQSGTIGEALGDSLVVRVLDRFGDPVTGATIDWTAEAGGSVSPATSSTSSAGMAATQRVLGEAVGVYVTTAEVSGVNDGPEPVVFTTTGVAARLTFIVEPPATAVSGVVLAPQPVLQLQDAAGGDIAREGVVVRAQITAGGGTIDGAVTATSDAAGQVTFADLTLRGSPGTRTLSFTADGFASATAPVGLGVGAPASIEGTAGDDQTAVAGSAVAVPPAVLVRDGDGNPLAGVPVSFKVTRGGGSLNGANPVTGGDGIAAVGGWTLGNGVGTNTVEAKLSGLTVSGSPVVFNATATPGPVSATRSQVTAAPASIAASAGSAASRITVTARDALDNPIPGLEVVLAATGSGNTLTQPEGPTAADGTAAGSLSATTPGDRTVSATVGGTAIDQTAPVHVTAGAPVAGRSSATVPNGTAGSATVVEIRLKDAEGNDVAGQPGTIAVAVSGANTVGSVPVADKGAGGYTATYTPTRAGSDQVQVKVSGSGVPGSPFASSVQPGLTSAASSSADVPACRTIAQLPVRVTVTARDAFANRVGHGGDDFALQLNSQGVDLTDQHDGTYTADLRPALGPNTVKATLRGSPIQGSPYSLFLTFPPPFGQCP